LNRAAGILFQTRARQIYRIRDRGADPHPVTAEVMGYLVPGLALCVGIKRPFVATTTGLPFSAITTVKIVAFLFRNVALRSRNPWVTGRVLHPVAAEPRLSLRVGRGCPFVATTAGLPFSAITAIQIVALLFGNVALRSGNPRIARGILHPVTSRTGKRASGCNQKAQSQNRRQYRFSHDLHCVNISKVKISNVSIASADIRTSSAVFLERNHKLNMQRCHLAVFIIPQKNGNGKTRVSDAS